MDEPGTDTLRKLAPCWTLAGDERLLTILQNTHQKLVAKCQEASCQLEQMVSALDDASITLQNVNNQFMALSSNQFIESRVYDDDADVTTEIPSIKEPPKPAPPDELSILKRSIAVIENTHEVITILNDSDTESDSDDDVPDRLVMKPKDLYADRPLPYIIGSEPWKNKWHAGLMPEDSDTDSSTSKVDQNSDQYSQSEPEDFAQVHPMKSPETSSAHHVRNLSETSSELPSEATPNTKPSPAAVASELARRLGAGLPPPKTVEVVPEYEEVSKPAARKIYKPQEPVTSTIFPDEPPPIDASSDEGDIFADLHRHQPYSKQYNRQYVTDELFGDDTENDDGGDIFSDFANQPPSAKPTSIFDAGPTPHMFDKQQLNIPTGNQTATNESPTRPAEDISKNAVNNEDDKGIRKPIGGISLFGSNKGTESIGAAILKRNQRKSSTSGDESGNDVSEPQPTPIKEQPKEKDIFDDLFAKNESKKAKPKVDSIAKEINENNQNKNEKAEKDAPKAVDIFSDNLFDDIDDIFTTNIVKNSKDNKKSIFEDDDDLFSDIAEPKTVKHDFKKNNNAKKTLFDSDDDLFSENIADVKPVNERSAIVKENSNKVTEITKDKENISIFDDGEENMFSNNKINEQSNSKKVQNVSISTVEANLKNSVETSKNAFKSPSLFDDDEDVDDSDLFAKPVKPATVTKKNETINNVKATSEINSITEEISKKYVNDKITNLDVGSNVISSKMDVSSAENNSTLIKSDKIFNIENSSVEIKSTTMENNISNGVPDTEQRLNNKITEPVNEKLTTDNFNNTSTSINKMLENDIDKTSDDDFSEQDFDDETVETPKPAQYNVSDIPDEKTSNPTNVQNIFDNIGLEEEEDIFASPNTQNSHKNDLINKSATQEKNSTEVTPKSDIFADILSEPPEFEKPKEPKKSKNVNALFDDDSDDEALFFKKDDVITDEKPEDFTLKQDRLFGLFTDEPPDDLDDDLFSTLPKPKIPNDKVADNDLPMPGEEPITNDEIKLVNEIEVVVQKTQQEPDVKTKAVFKTPSTEMDTSLPAKKLSSSDSVDEMFVQRRTLIGQQNLSDDDEELFKSLPAQLPPQKTEESDEELFKSLPILDQSTTATKELPKSMSNTEIFKVPTTKPERKVGKLKLGLNINVNALLPGASPKRVKTTDTPDGQTESVAEVKNYETIQSVGFDEKPSSEILDNKLSKDRPRIQVKRKPSTRKARREAVRKSGIDFGDDSTDNSSSIDDPPRTPQVPPTDINKNIEIKDEIISKDNKPESKKSNVNPIDTPVKSEIKTKATEHPKIELAKPPVKSDSTTKIVYILNDEDIFNTSVIESPPQAIPAVKEPVVEKTDHFDSPKNNYIDSKTDQKSHSSSSNMEASGGINTVGKVYKATSKEEKKSFLLFGEGDDGEELFKTKTSATKVSIFDSDSEGELFGTKKVEKVTKVEKVKEVKGSLFGDDDDDDDLFGTKAKKNADLQPQPTRATASAKGPAIPAQTVFEDPLSMFGDDN